MSERLKISSVGDDELRTLSVRARRVLARLQLTFFDELNQTILENTRNCGLTTTKELLKWKAKHLEKQKTDGCISAFPRNAFDDDGMTLRDYFAAKAMQGEFACQAIDWSIPEREYENSAIRFYKMADAMLKAREK